MLRILFGVLIVGVGLFMGARLRDSSRAAVLSLALLYPLAERDFQYGGIDHHGLLDLVLAGSLLLLLYAARRPVSLRCDVALLPRSGKHEVKKECNKDVKYNTILQE